MSRRESVCGQDHSRALKEGDSWAGKRERRRQLNYGAGRQEEELARRRALGGRRNGESTPWATAKLFLETHQAKQTKACEFDFCRRHRAQFRKPRGSIECSRFYLPNIKTTSTFSERISSLRICKIHESTMRRKAHVRSRKRGHFKPSHGGSHSHDPGRPPSLGSSNGGYRDCFPVVTCGSYRCGMDEIPRYGRGRGNGWSNPNGRFYRR